MLRSLNITQIYLLLKNQYSMHESIMLHKVSYDENYYSQARTILYSIQTSGKQSDQKFLFKPGFPMIA